MQDVLGLGPEARMNRPSSTSGNWDWRLAPKSLQPRVVRRLHDMCEVYGRSRLMPEPAPEV